MKKILSIFTAILLLVSITACSVEDKGKLTFAMPDGAPTLAAFSMMDGVTDLNGYKMEYTVVSGAANIATTFTSGEADVAVMPTNVAAKLYNNGVKIKLLTVNVYGVLYMVGKTPITNFDKLYGKVVYNIGAGGTPDLALRAIFDGLNIAYEESETPIEGKVALSYVSEASAAVAKIRQDANVYGVLGEPVATNCVNATGASVVMNLQQEWKNLYDTAFPQAGVAVSERVYNDSALVSALKGELSKNPAYIAINASKVKETIARFGSSLTVDFTAELLERCNLKCVPAKDAKTDLEAYFTAIKNYDATFIGGNLPNEGFYL